MQLPTDQFLPRHSESPSAEQQARRKPYRVAMVSLMAVFILWLVWSTFATPRIPAVFQPTAFAGFEGWSCSVEQWGPLAKLGETDLRDRTIYAVNAETGALEESILSQVESPPSFQKESVLYTVSQKGDSLDVITGQNFTGKIVFRESPNHVFEFILEPRRINLRYFRGNLVESLATRTDL